jgi:RimJ/RimL family protein N-acetyltransferase
VIVLRERLTLGECLLVRDWRNAPEVASGLRSGWVSEEHQRRFFADVIEDPSSPHRYFALSVDDGPFIGMAGLTYIANRSAEISLIIDPALRHTGVGWSGVNATLDKAWAIGLERVRGECYHTAAAKGFWLAIMERVHGRLDTFQPAGPTMTWTWGKP